LANHHAIAKFKSHQYIFSIAYQLWPWLLLNDFAKLISRQIHYFNKSPNIISANICSYTVYCDINSSNTWHKKFLYHGSTNTYVQILRDIIFMNFTGGSAVFGQLSLSIYEKIMKRWKTGIHQVYIPQKIVWIW